MSNSEARPLYDDETRSSPAIASMRESLKQIAELRKEAEILATDAKPEDQPALCIAKLRIMARSLAESKLKSQRGNKFANQLKSVVSSTRRLFCGANEDAAVSEPVSTEMDTREDTEYSDDAIVLAAKSRHTSLARIGQLALFSLRPNRSNEELIAAMEAILREALR